MPGSWRPANRDGTEHPLCRWRLFRFLGSHLALTDTSLAEILRLHGFEIEKSIARFLPYTMVNQRAVPSATVSLYLKLPVAWRIFGKQFLIVARKPTN